MPFDGAEARMFIALGEGMETVVLVVPSKLSSLLSHRNGSGSGLSLYFFCSPNGTGAHIFA